MNDYLLLIHNNLTKFDQNQTNFLASTVLTMYISWNIYKFKSDVFESLHTLYQILTDLTNKMISFNNPPKHLCFLLVSASHICLLNYLKSRMIQNLNGVTQCLQNFYSLPFEFPPDSFGAIEFAMNLAHNLENSHPQKIKELYAYVGIICEEKKNYFPSSTAQKIADDLAYSLSQLDLTGLTLYQHLTKHLPKESNIQIFNLFGNSIWKHILQEKEPFIKAKIKSHPKSFAESKVDELNSATEVAYRFYDKERFTNGVNLEANFIFPDMVPIEELVKNEMVISLDLIASIAGEKEELIFILFETLNGIIQRFKNDKIEDENEKNHQWDINIVFLYFCQHFYNYVRESECNVLFAPPFFDPDEAALNYNQDEFKFISLVRSIIIKIIISSPKDLIDFILYRWMNQPLLFAEIIHRISSNIACCNKNNLNSYQVNDHNFKYFCRCLMKTSLHFQHWDYSTDDEKIIESVEIARTSILLLISTLFSFPLKIINRLWSDNNFVSFFLSFLFEVPLRSFILSNLLSYLSKLQDSIPEVLLFNLQQILEICFPSFPEDKFVILATDIISTLNEAFLHRRSIAKPFQSFLPRLINSLTYSTKTEPMQNYILQCIQFLSTINASSLLDANQFKALDKSIAKAFDNKIQHQLWNKLIQLIAGDTLSSLAPTFIISNPKAVELFVHVSMNDEKIVDCINFIKSLVEFSSINANLLRESDFDVYLIDCIKKVKNEEVVDAFLNLFQQIAITVSSISVVQKYISLLSPYEGKYYSDFQEKYISTLNNIVLTTMKYPIGALKMNNPEGAVEIIGLNNTEISKGFTFVCWIQLDEFQDAKYNPLLIYLQDSKGNKLSFFISASNLYCQQVINKYEYTGKADQPIIRKGKWSFVSVTFRNDSSSSFITPYYGSKEMKILEFASMNFQPGPIKCKVAGIRSNSMPASGYEARMCAFGLFPPLVVDELDVIYQIGPRGTGFIPIKPICFIAPDMDDSGVLILKHRHFSFSQQNPSYKDNSTIPLSSSLHNSSISLSATTLNKVEESSSIENATSSATSFNLIDSNSIRAVFVKNGNKHIKCDQTFTLLLTQFCKIDILLPLFDQFSMTKINSESFPNKKLTIDLFKNLLSFSNKVQKSFYKSKGINIISNLLYSNKEEIIDYSLYLQFFSMIQIITYDPLIKQIIKKILLDVELWMRADAENHLRIIRHWDRTLFPSFLSYVSDMFQDILTIMRVYYWYDYVIEEQEIIKCQKRTRNEKLNVSECRQLLASIAALISTQNFTKDDFNCIISHCLSCVEEQQVIDLLMLIRSIGLTDPSPLLNLSQNNEMIDNNQGSDFISFLYLLMPKRNHLVFGLIFEITILVYKCQLIQTPCLNDQIMLFMDQLSPSRITPDLFFRTIDSIKNGFYEMFPVCCWLALNESVTENHILLMLDQIIPSPLYATDQTWTFWPIVLSYLAKSFLIPYRILGFIISCDCSFWQKEYAMIHDIGSILNKDSEPMKSLFLHCIAKFIEDEPNIQIENTSSFFLMAKRYLLFKKKDDVNKRLHYLFNRESLFEKSVEINEINYSYIINQPEICIDEEEEDGVSVDDDLYENNYYHMKKKNYIKSLSPSNYKNTLRLLQPYSVFGSAPTNMETNPSCMSRANSNCVNMKKTNNDSFIDFNLDMEVNANLKMKSIISNLSFINEIDCFGIRLDDQGNWTDIELVEITMGLFCKYPLKSFLDFDLILCSFLLHQNPEVAIEHIKKLSVAIIKGNLAVTYQSSIDLFIYHCKSLNIDLDPSILKPSQNYQKNAFSLIEKFSYLSTFDDSLMTNAKQLFIVIKNEFSDLTIQKVAQSLFTQNFDDIINKSRDQILNFIEKDKEMKRKNKQLWTHFWRNLKIDPAPWSVNLGFKAHFKRDTTYCSFGCPFKLKRNWEFNDHKNETKSGNGTDETLNNNENNNDKLIEITVDLDTYCDNKKSLLSIPCQIIKPTTTKSRTFSLYKNRIEMITNEKHITTIYLSDIKKIYFRNYKSKPTSFELFTLMKKSYFVNFPNHKSIPILKIIKSLGTPNAKFIQTVNFNIFINQVGLKVLWQHNRISNFKYLMHLNMMSGRSFNDLIQYPIFPWIISDMVSKSAEDKFKNLVDVERLKRYIEEYKEKKPLFSSYSASTLNSYKISDYLMRVEPFTSLYTKLARDNQLLFESIDSSFSLSAALDNDFCFLIPEFFFDFEFLKNSNKFDFVNGIDDVALPKWTNNDHFYFIYMMRKALESDVVSSNLNQWIDLVWGTKQPTSDTFSSFKAFANKLFTDGSSNNVDDANNAETQSIPQLPKIPKKGLVKPSSMNLQRATSRSKLSSLLSKSSDNENQDNGKESPPSSNEMQISENQFIRRYNFSHKSKPNVTDLHPVSNISFDPPLPQKRSKLPNFPTQLFFKPHPRKNINETSSLQFSRVFSVPPSRINSVSLALFEIAQDWKFKVVEISKKGLVVTHMIDFEQRKRSQKLIFRSDPSLSVNPSLPSQKEKDKMEGIKLHFTTKEINGYEELGIDIFERNNSASLIGRSAIAVVSPKTNKLYVVDIDKGTIEEVMSNVTGITAYKDFFAISLTDELLNVYRGQISAANQMFTLPSFGDKVRCSCINRRFFVAVVGTSGGKLLINSLNKGSIVNTIDLNRAQPCLVTVTKSWGFIVCYAKKVRNGILEHYLMTFSINGELIRKVKIDFEVAVWTSWTSNKSFDYMAVADKNGKLFAFEVFFLNIGDHIHRCRSRIITMTYLQDLACIATVTEDGGILFVPDETT